MLLRGRADPAWFVEEMLGAPLWDQQRDVIRAVFQPHARVAWKASPSVGKTYAAARAVIAFFLLYPGCKILTTAPSWNSVANVLWGEIREAWERMPGRMGVATSETRLRGGPNWWAMGLSTDLEERFKGHKAANLLVVVDEAPGVSPAIYRAIDTLRAGGNVRVLMLGNPTISSGVFYDAFSTGRESWRTFSTGAFDTPNLAGVSLECLLAMSEAELDTNVMPQLTTRRWVREQHLELGPHHPLWQANVLSEFPSESEYALIPIAWVERARQAPDPEAREGEWTAGIDVAEPGETGCETVLCVRCGTTIVELRGTRSHEPQGEVLAWLTPYKRRGITVRYDSIGVGAYFTAPLKAAGYRCEGVNVGLPAANKERFANLKAELYWGLRDRFKDGQIAGVTDQRLIAQLTALRYEPTPRGQIAIESKVAMLTRGVKSPDRAEAVMLAFSRQAADPLRHIA